MSEVQMVVRTVKIVDHVDTKYSWEEASNKSTSIGWKVWLWWIPLVLFFKRWETVLAPKGTECAVTTMGGIPIYEYKKFRGKVYYLGPRPSPGFPGS